MHLVRCLIRLLVIALTVSACTGAETPPPPDPYAPYRPAMLEDFQGDLDQLPPVPRYKLTLDVDMPTRHLDGKGTVIVPNRLPVPLSDLYFRLYPNLPQYRGRLSLEMVTVGGALTAFDYAPDGSSLHVILPEPLPPDQTVEIGYTWSLDAPTSPTGYMVFGESQGILSLPLSYPILAVPEMDATGQRPNWHLEVAPPHADVAFTESALYQVELITAPEITAVSSGIVVSQTTTAEGKLVRQFVTGPVREFTLIMSPQFQEASEKIGDTTVHSYFLPEDRQAGQQALAYAAAATQVYSDRFGPYPFTDLSVVEAPLQYRGMEYPEVNLIGIDTYRERREDQEFLIAHEIAHQWWYNLVGNDPVNRPWLDEGLAEYSTYIYYETIYGKERADRLLRNRWEVPLAYARENGLDTIVGQPASGFGPVNYETMVYAKSALFFHALRQEMGDIAFFKLLRTLVSKYRYQILTPDDLLAEARRASGRDVMPVYRQWILTAEEP